MSHFLTCEVVSVFVSHLCRRVCERGLHKIDDHALGHVVLRLTLFSEGGSNGSPLVHQTDTLTKWLSW